jgi:hypothetical protein
MSHSDDDKGGKKKPEDSPETSESGKRSGRASFDSRGNSVWEWQLETGVYSRDVNTQKLEKLDLGELSIADSGIHPQPTGLGPGAGKPAPHTPATPTVSSPSPPQRAANSGGAARGAGGNPYDSQSSGNRQVGGGAGFNPYDSANTGNRNIGSSGSRNTGTGGGFNPYDSTGRPPAGGDTNPYDHARVGNRLNPEPPAPERRRTPADLRKLDQQIKEQRKKLNKE